MSQNTKRNARKMHAEQRRAYVADLKERGLHYREIADAVHARFPETCPPNYDYRSAYQDVRYVLDRAVEEQIRHKAPLRALHTARLERMHATFWDLALAGDNDAFAKVFKVLEREAKMWGLDAALPAGANSLPIPEYQHRMLLALRLVQEWWHEEAADEATYLAGLGRLQRKLEAAATLLALPGNEESLGSTPALPEG